MRLLALGPLGNPSPEVISSKGCCFWFWGLNREVISTSNVWDFVVDSKHPQVGLELLLRKTSWWCLVMIPVSHHAFQLDNNWLITSEVEGFQVSFLTHSCAMLIHYLGFILRWFSRILPWYSSPFFTRENRFGSFFQAWNNLRHCTILDTSLEPVFKPRVFFQGSTDSTTHLGLIFLRISHANLGYTRESSPPKC